MSKPVHVASDFVVDPTNIPLVMEKNQREYWVLFGICVAGKGASLTNQKLFHLLGDAWIDMLAENWNRPSATPFEQIRYVIEHHDLLSLLKKHKMGQYTRIEKAFRQVVNIDVDNMSLSDLEAIPGIGRKTARMVMLYTTPNSNCVPLDTHILKFLSRIGVQDVPMATPASARVYSRLETFFQFVAQEEGMSVRDLDTLVWKSYQSGDFTPLKIFEGAY